MGYWHTYIFSKKTLPSTSNYLTWQSWSGNSIDYYSLSNTFYVSRYINRSQNEQHSMQAMKTWSKVNGKVLRFKYDDYVVMVHIFWCTDNVIICLVEFCIGFHMMFSKYSNKWYHIVEWWIHQYRQQIKRLLMALI